MCGVKLFLSGVGSDNASKTTCCWGWLAKVVTKAEDEDEEAGQEEKEDTPSKKRKMKTKKSTWPSFGMLCFCQLSVSFCVFVLKKSYC